VLRAASSRGSSTLTTPRPGAKAFGWIYGRRLDLLISLCWMSIVVAGKPAVAANVGIPARA
jgi:hypothetical protein